MADTPWMLPKWYRADVKLLDVINCANSKLAFFCNCKAADQKQLVNGSKLIITQDITKTK